MTEAASNSLNQGAPAYPDNYSHIRDELLRLDLLIRRRIAAFRARLDAMPETAASHPMYISHDEVDWLLVRRDDDFPSPGTEEADRNLELMQQRLDAGIRGSSDRGVFLALPRLARIFNLSRLEVQTIIICLAPELDRKYDRLYAYLQDDITRKRPSVDLALDLLCRTGDERWRARRLFSGTATLFRAGIIRMLDDDRSQSGSSGLSRFLQLDRRILGYLLGDNSLDERLPDLVRQLPPLSPADDVPVEPAAKHALLRVSRRHFGPDSPCRKPLVFHLHGPCGVGKREVARSICGELGCSLLFLDLDLLPTDPSLRGEAVRTTLREGLLLQAAIYLANVDAALMDAENGLSMTRMLARLTEESGWLVFLAGEKPWQYRGVFQETVFRSVELPLPGMVVRKAAWEDALKRMGRPPDPGWINQLAARFRLTPGRIRDAAELAVMRSGEGEPEEELTLAELFRACRDQSSRKLAELALKIEPRHRWDDLVLPDNQLAQLREICNQVKHDCRVFGDWGFGRKQSRGRGLSVLFSGPSGTGKTMGAEVIAHELQLELYRIDLSRVVSKYIGETEKNLSTVFQEAESCNAVLFFDEADALFGKRTEVSDAHDRYANVETSYLLQRMEEYEGVVILATNLRDNMDEAFTRRLRFIVEFPFPDESGRSQIWRGHFPAESPVSDLLDYDDLARRYRISGGNIRNIVLNAAFLAAEDGGVIGMNHLLHGTRREFEKIGKVWTEDMFRHSGTPGNGRKG